VKYRVLVAVPLLAVAAFWIALSLVPASEHAALYRLEIELAKAAALVGCAAAALRFAPGDYLRTAWLLLGQCYLLILVNDVLLRAGMGVLANESWAPAASAVVVLVANVGSLVGTVMVARVWRVAGFELAGSPMVRRAVVLIAVAIALVSAGDLVFTSAREIAHGQSAAWLDLISAIADIISFSLIAPFLLTAVAFRGGSLGWTWALLTASLFGWLLFDATLSLGTVISANGDAVKRVSETARLLACGFGMVAGVAQRFAVRSVPSTVMAPAEG
jgi:hypothetical protein